MTATTATNAPRRIYLDNAATTFPKPPAVHNAMLRYATEVGASPGRGTYAESLEGARLIEQCRRRVAQVVGADSPAHVVFTLNTSDALNLAIRGIAANRRRTRPNTPIHIVTTAMDHNSVLRPLNALKADGLAPQVTSTRVEVNPATGIADPAHIEAALTDHTALIAVVHASNVTGALQPIDAIAKLAQRRGIPLLVDAAQTAGRYPIHMHASGIDLLAFPGHKAMLGPLGTGCLVIKPGTEHHIDTIREGGTGTVSELDTHPHTMPDKYEPGSHNTPGIVGLSEGARYVLDRTVNTIRADELALITRITAELSTADRYPGLTLLGPPDPNDRVGVFTLTHDEIQPAELAAILEADFGLLTRAGIHCAPHAHRTLGTRDTGGGLRISLGPFTTEHDTETLLHALREVTATFTPA